MNFGDTWYDEHGTGDPLVLLHPGGADSRAWEANLPPLAERFRVSRPTAAGTGARPTRGELTFDAMARDTIAFIEAVAGGPVELAGCSDGATVGLLVAYLRPDLVKRLAFVCGVFHHKGWLPGSIELDEEADAFLGGWYAEVSPDGADHWPVVKAKLYIEHLTEPSLTPADLAGIDVPTLVMTATRTRSRSSMPSRLPRPAGRAAGDRPGHLARAAGRAARALQRDVVDFFANRPTSAHRPGLPFDPPPPKGRTHAPLRTTRRKAHVGLGGAAARSRRPRRSPSAKRSRTRPTGPPGRSAAFEPGHDTLWTEADEHRQDRELALGDELGQPRAAARRRRAGRGAGRSVTLHQGPAHGRIGLRDRRTADDFCYVRGTSTASPMDPDGAGFQAMGSEDGTAESGRLRVDQARRRRPARRPHRAARARQRDPLLVGRLDVRRLAAPVGPGVGAPAFGPVD